MKDNYYYGQGRVFLAPLNNKHAFRWVGDVSALSIAFSHEQKISKLSRAGQLYQNRRFITELNGSIRSTWHDFSVENLAVLLGATVVDEPFSYNVEFPLPDVIRAGDVIALPHTTVFNVHIDGLVRGQDYEVDRQWGTLEFFIALTVSKKIVRYEHLFNQWLPFFSVKTQEFCMRYQGGNMADETAPILLELYRLSVDPLATLEMITTGGDVAGMEMTSLLLPDLSRQNESVFSCFGRIQFVTPQPTLTYNGRAKYDGSHQYRGK